MLAFLALGACSIAFATNLTLTWQPPTSYTDGTPIASGTAITYNIYGALQGELLQQLATGVTATTATRTSVDPGVRCYAVSAVVAGVESAQTAPVCATVAPPVANPPNGLTVAITVADNTVYTLVKEVDRFVMLPVGTVPAGTPCDPMQNANGYFAVPRASVKFTGNVQPPIVLAKCS
jgi:hypothetical protein